MDLTLHYHLLKTVPYFRNSWTANLLVGGLCLRLNFMTHVNVTHHNMLSSASISGSHFDFSSSSMIWADWCCNCWRICFRRSRLIYPKIKSSSSWCLNEGSGLLLTLTSWKWWFFRALWKWICRDGGVFNICQSQNVCIFPTYVFAIWARNPQQLCGVQSALPH